MTITLLASGGLGLRCLSQLIDRRYLIRFVFTDYRSDEIIEYCQRQCIPHFVGNPRNGKAVAILDQAQCDVLLSVNYLFIVDQEIIKLGRAYAINFHGSLLPKYRGRTPHVWAIINGESVAGVTAHLMTLEMDAGDIVGQRVVPIDHHMTGADVLNIYADVYPEMIVELLDQIPSGMLRPIPQQEKKATYFPKRSPEDGLIDWNWSRYRLRNWIRAQAAPYPGAFFYVGEQKVTVHWSAYDDAGFNHADPNGTVLRTGPDFLVVKLVDGALRLGPVSRIIADHFTLRK